MANSISSIPVPVSAVSADDDARPLAARGIALRHASLATMAPGADVRVVSIVLESDMAAYVGAVGIREGDRLVVLRHAAFGGPVHVRTRAGGEFALARSLAAAILVRVP